MLQCFAERRAGGETGVKAVQLLADDAVWKAADDARWSRSLLDAALARGEKVTPGPVAETAERPVACLIEYNDGFRATALGLGGKVAEYLVAVKIQGEREPKATLCYIPIENSNNFSPLVDSIGRMFTQGTLGRPSTQGQVSIGKAASQNQLSCGGEMVDAQILLIMCFDLHSAILLYPD